MRGQKKKTKNKTKQNNNNNNNKKKPGKTSVCTDLELRILYFGLFDINNIYRLVWTWDNLLLVAVLVWHKFNLLFLIVHYFLHFYIRQCTVPFFGILARNDCGVQSTSVSCLEVLQGTSQTEIQFVAIIIFTNENNGIINIDMYGSKRRRKKGRKGRKGPGREVGI